MLMALRSVDGYIDWPVNEAFDNTMAEVARRHCRNGEVMSDTSRFVHPEYAKMPFPQRVGCKVYAHMRHLASGCHRKKTKHSFAAGTAEYRLLNSLYNLRRKVDELRLDESLEGT